MRPTISVCAAKGPTGLEQRAGSTRCFVTSHSWSHAHGWAGRATIGVTIEKDGEATRAACFSSGLRHHAFEIDLLGLRSG